MANDKPSGKARHFAIGSLLFAHGLPCCFLLFAHCSLSREDRLTAICYLLFAICSCVAAVGERGKRAGETGERAGDAGAGDTGERAGGRGRVARG